jgi:hypothetical protein
LIISVHFGEQYFAGKYFGINDEFFGILCLPVVAGEGAKDNKIMIRQVLLIHNCR